MRPPDRPGSPSEPEQRPDRAGSPDQRSGWLDRLGWLVAVVLTLLVLALHLLRFLHAGALWRDEAAAVQLATLPSVGEVYAEFPHEAFPLLFPLSVRGFAALAGTGDTALRGLGLGIGVALLAALWLNTRIAAIGGAPPLASLALVGLNSTVLRYGDGLRGYGLGSVLVVLAFGLTARALARPSRAAAAGAWLAGLGAAHCLLQSSALLLGIGLAAAVAAWRRAGGRAAAAVLAGGGAIAASLLPYAGPLRAARDWDVLVRSPIDLGHLVAHQAAWLAALGFAMVAAAAALRAAPSPQAGAAGDLGAVGVAARREQVIFSALAAVLAATAFAGFSWILGYAPRPWYYLPLLALLAAACDLLLAAAGRPARALLLAGVAAAVVGLAGPAAVAARMRQTNVDQLAALVEEGAARDDLVLVNPWTCGISFRRYYRGAAPWTTLPSLADHRFHRYDLLKAKMMSPHPIDDVIDRLGRTLRGGHRVWLVGGVGLSPTPAPVVPLPPAPGSPSGWDDVAYSVAWSRQAGAFLQAHTVQWQGMRLSGGDPIDPLEHLPLLIAYGWKQESQEEK